MKEETRQQIRVFSAARMPQKNIAKQLGLSVHLVRKTQKEFSLLPHSTEPLPPATQKQILEFLHKHGAPTVARILGVLQHQIYRVAREANFRRGPGSAGFRYRFTALELRAIRRDTHERGTNRGNVWHVPGMEKCFQAPNVED
jgi:hypothetical protein